VVGACVYVCVLCVCKGVVCGGVWWGRVCVCVCVCVCGVGRWGLCGVCGVCVGVCVLNVCVVW